MDIGGEWFGRYRYAEGGDPVPFEARIKQAGTALNGRILEPNTFLQRGPDELRALIDGTAVGGSVTFLKTYQEFRNDGAVAYAGRLSVNGKRIEGEWHFPDHVDWRGDFVMMRKPRVAARAVLRAEEPVKT